MLAFKYITLTLLVCAMAVMSSPLQVDTSDEMLDKRSPKKCTPDDVCCNAPPHTKGC